MGADGKEIFALVAVGRGKHLGNRRSGHYRLKQTHDLGLYGGIRVAAEGSLDQNKTRTVEVDCRAECHAHDALGSEVPGRAHHAVAVRGTRTAERVSGAKMSIAQARNAYKAVALDENGGGLNISVNDLVGVQERERAHELPCNTRDHCLRQRRAQYLHACFRQF
jgi:hypothetical protein